MEAWEMTNLEFWICVVIYSNVFINIGAMIFFQYKKLDEVEGYMAGNESVEWNRAVCGSGFKGRQMRLHMLFATIFMARRLQKNGFLAEGEIKKIPRAMRNQIKALYVHAAITCFCVAVFHFAVVTNRG